MRRRLLVSYLSITAFVLLVLEIPLGLSYASSEQGRLTSDVQHNAFALVTQAQGQLTPGGVDRPALQDVADRYHADHGGRVTIVDERGLVVADSQTPAASRTIAGDPDIAAALRGVSTSGTRHSGGASVLSVTLPIASAGGGHGAARVTLPMSAVDDRIRRDWLLLGATAAAVLGIVFLVSLLLARSVTRPLAALESAAARLGAGDLAVRADVPDDPAEVRSLAQSFNATAMRLEQLVAEQRRFVADASHQLRTPLAALRLRLENLEADVHGAAAEDLEGALAEVGRLSRLVDGLLVLARAGHATSSPVPVDVAEVIHGRQDAWGALAAERHVRIDASVVDQPTARATSGRLEQVVDNLLNNALEVAPPRTVVHLSAELRDGWVELRVDDEGPGLTDAERARAFDRFWQSGPSREIGGRHARDGGGFGLGLAIVRELVVGDGGRVELAMSPAGGLRVIVRLRPAERKGYVVPEESHPAAPERVTSAGQPVTTSG